MSLLNKLTIKNLKLNKKRTIVTIIGIMLSVALITSVASIYHSGIASLIRFETYQKGNFHVAYYDVPMEDVNVFQNHREIENYFITKNIGYAKISSKNTYKPYAFVKAFTKSSLENLSIKLVEGRLPENEGEIVIPTHLKTNGRLTLSVGSEITLDVGTRIYLEDHNELNQNNPFLEDEAIINTTSKTYKIVGIIERPASNIESYSAAGYTFITFMKDTDLDKFVDVYAKYTKDGTKRAYALTANILGVDEYLFERYYSGKATLEEMEQFTKEEQEKIKYNIDINTYLIGLENDPLGISSVGELSIVAAIVIAIILFTSVFCIKNSFDISITEKTKQYGMLKSIGATKKQIKRNVFYEATILGMIGIPLGILLGLLASYILILISNYFLRDSLAIGLSLIFSFSFYAILVAVVLGIITIYLSAFNSARRASKISPIDSIRNSANIKINKNKIKSPKYIRKIFGMGGEISYKNLKRNKKKYRTTVISIIVSVFIFIALSSFMEMAFDSVENELNISDFNLSLITSSVTDEETLEKYVLTTQLEHIENYTILRQADFSYQNGRFSPEYLDFLKNEDWENDSTQYVSIYALGNVSYQKYIKELGLDYEEIKDKGILMDYLKVGRQEGEKVIYKTLRLTDYKTGDVLKGTLEYEKDFQIEIGCITDKFPFGLKNNTGRYLVVSDELFQKVLGNTIHDLNILYHSDDAEQLQDDIEDMLKDENYSLNNVEENVKMMNNLFTLIGIFLYGFIIVITLIGITNIFNTITTSMELRRQEFAMLKSIGMTSKEFKRMIRLETFFMGMKAILFGVPIGIGLSYLIYVFLAKNSGMSYHLPILAIILAIVAVFVLISIIMRYSMMKINKQNTIETIRNENI